MLFHTRAVKRREAKPLHINEGGLVLLRKRLSHLSENFKCYSLYAFLMEFKKKENQMIIQVSV